MIMENVLSIAIAWVTIAVVIWLYFLRRYAGQSTDIVIPGWMFILAIALWPIMAVIGAFWFIGAALLLLWRMLFNKKSQDS